MPVNDGITMFYVDGRTCRHCGGPIISDGRGEWCPNVDCHKTTKGWSKVPTVQSIDNTAACRYPNCACERPNDGDCKP